MEDNLIKLNLMFVHYHGKPVTIEFPKTASVNIIQLDVK